MIIKTFRAETSSAALKRVRQEMGGDAIVLKTTQETGALGRTIYEVTACLENPSVDQTSKLFPNNSTADQIIDTPKSIKEQVAEVTSNRSDEVDDVWKKRYEKLELKINSFFDPEAVVENKEDNKYLSITEQLQAHDISKEFIDEFISELEETYDGSEDLTIYAKIKLAEKLIQFTSTEITLKAGDKLAVVGPAGSGKSSVMGKLATSLVMKEKKKVTLLTLDDVKMGAYDETAAYAEILGADYADNRTAIESSRNTDSVTLIDTVALPHTVENIIPINDKLDAIGTSYRLAVFSAIMRSKDIATMKEHMQTIHATHLVITKSDLSTCLGSLITAAHAFGLKVLYTTDSQGGLGVLQTVQVDEIVNQILQVEVASE